MCQKRRFVIKQAEILTAAFHFQDLNVRRQASSATAAAAARAPNSIDWEAGAGSCSSAN
jgi:hypothetical protein